MSDDAALPLSEVFKELQRAYKIFLGKRAALGDSSANYSAEDINAQLVENNASIDSLLDQLNLRTNKNFTLGNETYYTGDRTEVSLIAENGEKYTPETISTLEDSWSNRVKMPVSDPVKKEAEVTPPETKPQDSNPPIAPKQTLTESFIAKKDALKEAITGSTKGRVIGGITQRAIRYTPAPWPRIRSSWVAISQSVHRRSGAYWPE